MLTDSLRGKQIKQLSSEIQKATIVAAAEAASPREYADRLERIKKELQRSNAGAVLLIAVQI
jgi:hypothetical protein